MDKGVKRKLRVVGIGAAVAVVLVTLWWVLAAAMSYLLHWSYAGVIAMVIIVVLGWIANGWLLWRQSRAPGPKPR